MKIFNIGNNYSIVCNFQKTRNGFKHTANLCHNGLNVFETKINYLNRTWECYEYESIILKVINNYFPLNERVTYLAYLKLTVDNFGRQKERV